MIWANQFFDVTISVIANQRAAMTAHIVKRSRLAVTVPDNNDGIAIHFEREIVARLRNFAGMPGKNPARPPYPLAIDLIHLFIGIKFPKHAPPGWLAGN